MSWEKMKEMKDAIFEGLRDIERVKSELVRSADIGLRLCNGLPT
jgi:hypothetical protein